eukprot:CAMPEP_0170629080 /NCGR_PEP_ID=MMETSP0224-20130122/33105_1 /TAXON_ID=285029 /ORGANISM="Togula jolla, Strain CCCM 725" /LENGTH=126 /DNA_ID=CAMNT_0010956705 /DNA_START=617 /DNA_END=998 /DNA_ORIENTATION=+
MTMCSSSLPVLDAAHYQGLEASEGRPEAARLSQAQVLLGASWSPASAKLLIMMSKLLPFGRRSENSGWMAGFVTLANHSSALAKFWAFAAARTTSLKVDTCGCAPSAQFRRCIHRSAFSNCPSSAQ